jgi:hypothetical protein
MGAVKGGDIRQLTIKGREFDVKGGDANVNIDLGGFANEGSLNGNGSLSIVQRRKLAGFSDCPVQIDDTRQDMEFLQAIADSGETVPVNMTLASNKTYSGALSILGEMQKASGDGTLTLEMRGAKFEQI